MSFVPITHNFPIMQTNEKMRGNILQFLAESGMKNIIIGFSAMQEAMKDPFLPEKLSDLARMYGVTFMDAHAHFPDPLCPSCPVEEKRFFMLNFLKTELAVCSRFGVKTLTVHTGNNFDRTLPLSTYQDALCRSLEELLPAAEKCDVILSLENIWTQPNTADVLLDVVKKFDCPYLGLCYDSGHANIMKYAKMEGSPARIWWNTVEEIPQDDQTLEKMLPYIVNCHLHDNNGLKDEHKLPGEGNIDWDHVMGLLKKAPRLQCIQNEADYLSSGRSLREVARIFEELCVRGKC